MLLCLSAERPTVLSVISNFKATYNAQARKQTSKKATKVKGQKNKSEPPITFSQLTLTWGADDVGSQIYQPRSKASQYPNAAATQLRRRDGQEHLATLTK
ncbi:hypothetical protein L1987_58320 [Smallanthus sonchifolius]|uniref:Uncharacterized protein n=1 Tax=Smallanthus sonchifolius TaxID=185202 RepID=A0ACB9DFZ9_9ASTR|nr:hypothetical protein L1987_58320 [Smallanthus sonchifolius]